jgi:hypothetical protein
MACQCNYSCSSTSSSMMMRKMQMHQIVHQLQTKKVVFTIVRKENEKKKIKFI